MEITRYEGNAARHVLIGVITDRAVCGAVAAKWDGNLFASRAENLIAGWAMAHYAKHRKPPGRTIELYFDRWNTSNRDKDTAKLIERFLTVLNEEAGNRHGMTPEVIIDQAGELFRANALRGIRDNIDSYLADGKINEAETAVQKYRGVQLGVGGWSNPLAGGTDIQAAFEENNEEIFRWSVAALGNFLDGVFEREGLVAFMGKAKVGKSFWLQEVAFQALMQFKNVAFFETGDQTKAQLDRRMAGRASKRPYKLRTDYRVKYPKEMYVGDPPELVFKEHTFDGPMPWQQANKALIKLGTKYGHDRLRVSVHRNRSISVLGIENILDDWGRDGWIPDIIIVDYADILAPISGAVMDRDNINATWQGFRALSQKTHSCLVTATQTDAASFGAKVLKRSNFTDDRRKLDHVTTMIGINQEDGEKNLQLTRLNLILGRDLEWSEDTCIWCAQCLAVANPAVLATM